jgi:hypothetical protein
LNISWDFAVLGKIIRKRGMFTVVVHSAGYRQVVDICLPLITSKLRFTHPSEMSSGGAETVRYPTTGFIGCWDLG